MAEGRATLHPDRFEVASVGSCTLRFAVGPSGIAAGGGLLIDIPKAWLSELYPVTQPFQTGNPTAPHYVGARASRPGTELNIALESVNYDGQTERFPHMVRLTVDGERLRDGDIVEVVLGRTSAPFIAGTDAVRVAVDADGDGRYRLAPGAAAYTVASGPPVAVALFAPSQAVVGEPSELQLTAFDRYDNPAVSMAGTWGIREVASHALPARFGDPGPGRAVVRWTPEHEGFAWPVAVGTLGGAATTVAGGPVRVFAKQPPERIYWGDLHSHSEISHDGVGGDHFAYARDATRLDVFASTEHSDDDAIPQEHDGISPGEWQALRERVAAYEKPGRFITLLGYELTLRRGHHNVYFRRVEEAPWAAPWPAQKVGSILNLWRHLPSGAAITVPHHLGRLTRVPIERPAVSEPLSAAPAGSRPQRGPAVSWLREERAIEHQPLLEIYSLHGSSERYDPEDPLAYERVLYLPSASARGRHYARNAWAEGLRLGVIASSDNHTAQPGLPHAGLAAIVAPELTREAIFRSLGERRTYATTGERIYLEFSVAGVPFGRETVAAGAIEGTVLAAAPRPIRYAEVVALSDKRWETVHRWDGPGRILDEHFTLQVDGPTTCYLRLELEGETRGRTARAWSSPVWVDPPTQVRSEAQASPDRAYGRGAARRPRGPRRGSSAPRQ